MNGTFIANQLQYINSRSAIRTIITYDNGAEWHLLPAPEVTKDGDETDCEVVCKACYICIQYVIHYDCLVASLFLTPPHVFD